MPILYIQSFQFNKNSIKIQGLSEENKSPLNYINCTLQSSTHKYGFICCGDIQQSNNQDYIKTISLMNVTNKYGHQQYLLLAEIFFPEGVVKALGLCSSTEGCKDMMKGGV